ncbi:MAG: SDR family NAD(P)-dependent oxidoreductase, partial [Caldilinea sp.]
LTLVAARGRLMGALPQEGEMLSLQAPESRVREAIAPYADEVSIAAINGPASVVISGQRAAVLAVGELLAAEGVKSQRLTVSHAFHSPLMEPMLEAFRQVAEQVTYHKPVLRLVSNVTGQLAGDEIATPEYWVRHVREAVRFADGVATLHGQGIQILIEIGPRPVLLGMAGGREQGSREQGSREQGSREQGSREQGSREQGSREQGSREQGAERTALLPSLRPGQGEWQQLLSSLGALYVRGVAIDWEGFDRGYSRRKVVLPTYPFQRQRYWVEQPQNRQQSLAHLPDGWPDDVQLAERIAARVHPQAVDSTLVNHILDALRAEQRTQGLWKKVEGYLYEVSWLPAAPAVPNPSATATAEKAGHWVILADRSGLGALLARQLCADGYTVTLLFADSSDLTAVSAALTADALCGVLHLWGLEASSLSGLPLEAEPLTAQRLDGVLEGQKMLLGSLLTVVQQLTQTGNVQAGPTIWVVTRGAQPAPDLSAAPAIDPLQAPLWGMGRVLSLECPTLWGGLIDLEPGTDLAPAQQLEQDAAALWQAVLAGDGEEQVAYRHGQRYVARLVRGEQTTAQQMPAIRPEGSYLITGGTGGLGLHSAQWLAEQGAQTIFLTSRRGVTQPMQQQRIDALAERGVAIQVVQVDVADVTAMRRLLTEIADSASPLRGVIHAAGTATLQTLQELTWAACAEVLRPKLAGGLLLQELLQRYELDFFVSYSSGAGIWGGKGQAHYGAANHFLDGLAAWRRQQGLAGLSIAWGPIAGGGMLTAADQQTLESMGVQALTQEEMLAVQARLLGGALHQQTVVHMDWRRFKALYQAGRTRPLLDALLPGQESDPEEEKTARTESVLRQELAVLSASQRPLRLREQLQQLVGRVLGMRKLPDPSVGLTDLG